MGKSENLLTPVLRCPRCTRCTFRPGKAHLPWLGASLAGVAGAGEVPSRGAKIRPSAKFALAVISSSSRLGLSDCIPIAGADQICPSTTRCNGRSRTVTPGYEAADRLAAPRIGSVALNAQTGLAQRTLLRYMPPPGSSGASDDAAIDLLAAVWSDARTTNSTRQEALALDRASTTQGGAMPTGRQGGGVAVSSAPPSLSSCLLSPPDQFADRPSKGASPLPNLQCMHRSGCPCPLATPPIASERALSPMPMPTPSHKPLLKL